MEQEKTQLLEMELRLTQQSFFKEHITNLKIKYRRRVFLITASAAICAVVLATVHCRLLQHFILKGGFG